MKIKASNPGLAHPRGRTNSTRTLPKTALGIAAVVMLTSVATYWVTAKYLALGPAEQVWEWAAQRGHAALRNDVRIREALSLIPERVMQSVPPLPKLVIDIKFRHMQKLYDKRAVALERGVLIQETGDFVPASIRHGDQTTRVRLRLKGDHTDHLDSGKWSFRIHVRGKQHLFGMRRFSIQHPKVRGYQGEPLFFETLRHVGVLAPRYFFVDVTVNGNNAGIMALEEHFSKEMLEANGRRDSPIIRFDESLFWAEFASDPDNKNIIFNDYRNAHIDAFGSSRIAGSERLSRQNATAVGLLRGFVSGELPPSEVFDVELMGRFLAVAQLWGSYHSMRWHNQRFYFNPITAKLEPIGFDADLQGRRSPDTILTQDDSLTADILDDPAIFLVFRETLRQLAREAKDGSLLEKLKKTEQEYLAVLQKEFYMLAGFPFEELVTRADYLLGLSEDELKSPPVSTKRYPTLIHAYLLKDDKGGYLEVVNVVPHEVEIQSVHWVGDGTGIDFQPLSPVSFPLDLSKKTARSLPKVQRIYYQSPSDVARYALHVTASIRGQEQRQTVIAEPYYPALEQHPIPISTVDEQLSRHSFLNLDKENQNLYVQPGHWQVEGSLVVPVGFGLTIPAGTTLQFEAEEGLIAHGPLNFEGSEEANIRLEGKPTDGDEGTWQGIAVLNAGRPSHWKHVTVLNTTGVDRPSWQLTGGVTFYRSDVHLDQCRFQGNRGEDALNIVHSKFRLDDIEILTTASDAFDADFADGIVVKGLFQDIGKAGGGDAIDISGSTVSVTGTRFLNIYDKALSVGERSEMRASDVVIEQTGTGAASKDGSRLDISNTTIKQAHNAGLMAYVKKPEYGSAGIEARSLTFVATSTQTLAEKGSAIVIDGKTVESQDVDVEQLYKTVMKPGLR